MTDAPRHISGLAQVRLKKGRESSLKRRHPWVFSGAIQKAPNNVEPGQTVDVVSADGAFLCRGGVSPRSQIRVRAWTFDPDQEVNQAFFGRRIKSALALRQHSLPPERTNARRLVFAESDGLPGVVVDQYGDWLAGQFLSAGAALHKETIVSLLIEQSGARGFYERSQGEALKKEGLAPSVGVLAGKEPPELVEIYEDRARYLVDIRTGHKTGFYLDQRENRAKLEEFSREAEVLNAFCFTGGFGIRAALAGAKRVTQLDSSREALDLARQNARVNGLDGEGFEYLREDAFEALRRFSREKRKFDLIVLDPPKFASSQAQVKRAARGYKDINRLAFTLLASGGVLFTFSCSGHISPELFQKIVADAALDANRQAAVIHWMRQSPDHPVALPFPESLYLKGLVCVAP